MFTGLIEGTGRVAGFRGGASSGGILGVVDVPWEDPITEGESIAVNGVCLTAMADSRGSFEAGVSPETLSRTNLSTVSSGVLVNLERPLRIGDRLGGHLVQGHVDGLGTWLKSERTGDFFSIEVQIPRPLQRYIVEKGSIGIDGISLTVASTTADRFTVAVIPKTWELTNLSSRKHGDHINLEVDIIAKYVEKLLHTGEAKQGLTEEFLGEHGFL